MFWLFGGEEVLSVEVGAFHPVSLLGRPSLFLFLFLVVCLFD